MSLRTATATRLGYVRRYPTDLAVASIAAVLAYFVVTSLGAGSAVRLLATFLLVLFLPGYALVAVLFPAAARPARPNESTAQSRPGGIDTGERLGLAFALSIAIVPAVVIVLSLTEWGLATEPLATAFAGVVVAFAQLGVVRRLRIPESERYSVSLQASLGWTDRVRRDDTAVRASTVFLALAVVTAAVALSVAFAAPNSAGGFTQLGLYSEDESGDLVAGELPSTVDSGESVSAVVELQNREGETRDYSLVVQQQVLEDEEVVERDRLEEVSVEVDDGEVAHAELEVTPTVDDGTVRIAILLYETEPPDRPTMENAEEDVFFWVAVAEDPGDEVDGGDDEPDGQAGDDEGDGGDDGDANDEFDPLETLQALFGDDEDESDD